jgi:hypothetical protein
MEDHCAGKVCYDAICDGLGLVHWCFDYRPAYGVDGVYNHKAGGRGVCWIVEGGREGGGCLMSGSRIATLRLIVLCLPPTPNCGLVHLILWRF